MTTKTPRNTPSLPPSPAHQPMALVGRGATMVFLLVGAPLYVAASLVAWNFNAYQGETADFANAFTEHPGLGLLGPPLALAGIIALTLGMLGMLIPCSARAPVVCRIAAVALVVQVFAFSADMGGVLTLNAIGAASGASVPAVVAESLSGESGALRWIGMVYLTGWLTGVVALVIALLRSHLAPWWVPASLAVAFVADFSGIRLAPVDFQLLLVVFAIGGAVAIAKIPAWQWHPVLSRNQPESGLLPANSHARADLPHPNS